MLDDALLDDPATLHADRTRALALASRFSFEESARRLEALYADVLLQPRRVPPTRSPS